MTQRSFGALVVLNVVLLVALVLVNLTPQPAMAQFGAPQFLMLAGKTTGRENLSTVYIVEIRNNPILLAVQFDSRTNNLTMLADRALAGDINAGAPR